MSENSVESMEHVDSVSSSNNHLFLDDQKKEINQLTKQFDNFNITIYGTNENPLFRAKEIGDALDIQNVRQVITDFPEDYKVVFQAYTPGGIQNVTGLTEFGLYELISISKKPIAKEFRRWTHTVLKEIRLTGEYKLKEEFQQERLEYKKQLEEKDKQIKKYIESFTPEKYKKHIYIYRQGNESRSIFYVGKSIQVDGRLNSHDYENSCCHGSRLRKSQPSVAHAREKC